MTLRVVVAWHMPAQSCRLVAPFRPAMPNDPTLRPRHGREHGEARPSVERRSRLAAVRHPPLWLRYVLAVIVFGGAFFALVIAEQGSHGGPQYNENPATEAQANRESEIVVEQDQAPHTTGLEGTAAPAVALARAISLDMARRIRRNELQGPLQHASCRPSGGGHASRRAFRCAVEAGDVSYPFLGVVDVSARQITWCKRDPPPVPSQNVPVSRRCRA